MPTPEYVHAGLEALKDSARDEATYQTEEETAQTYTEKSFSLVTDTLLAYGERSDHQHRRKIGKEVLTLGNYSTELHQDDGTTVKLDGRIETSTGKNGVLILDNAPISSTVHVQIDKPATLGNPQGVSKEFTIGGRFDNYKRPLNTTLTTRGRAVTNPQEMVEFASAIPDITHALAQRSQASVSRLHRAR